MYTGGVVLKKRKISKYIFLVFLLFGMVSILFIIVFDKSFAYQLEVYSEREVVNMINREVNSIIYEEIQQSGVTYGNIVTVDKNDIGEITCVKADMLTVNQLKNKIDIRIADIYESKDSFQARIPVGNLLGGGLLYGKGFDITVKFRPIGDAETKMTGVLNEAGINQTIYRIAFDANITTAVVFPFRYIEIPVEIETVVSETVIIGDVPQSYTYFNMEGEMSAESIQGYIEDFKAE